MVGLRVTPFLYYISMMEEIMEQGKSYDSLPNFTAADGMYKNINLNWAKSLLDILYIFCNIILFFCISDLWQYIDHLPAIECVAL